MSNKYNKLKEKYPDIDKVVDALKAEVPSEFNEDLVKSSLLAAFGVLNNDVNTSEVSPPDMEIEFGFDTLPELILSAIEPFYPASLNEVREKMQASVLGKIRGVQVEGYSSDLAEKDMELIRRLGTKTYTKYNEAVMDYIKTNDLYSKYFNETVDGILSVYKYTFQDSFGLMPYVGVVTLAQPFAFTVINNQRQAIANAETTFGKIYNNIAKTIDYEINTSRQFNIRELLQSSNRKVKYTPEKILEYALGREITYNLNKPVYNSHSQCNDWDKYAEAYVKPQVETYVLETIYYSLEKHANVQGSFLDDPKYLSTDRNELEKVFRGTLGSVDVSNEVLSDLQYIKKCLCASICVTDYNILGKNINSIAIRIVDVNNKTDTLTQSKVLKGLTTNEALQYDDAIIISDGKLTDESQSLPYKIIEYRQSYNPVLAEAEPEFGYKAVELYLNRGIQISWDNILLGKDINNTPLFAQVGNSDAIPMQSNTVHNVFAGSRAGKGVMTMNILASALAAGKPIFYIDRKPDMAVMFYGLTEGNMFIVNGGQYQAKNDPQGLFSDNGVAISGWSQAYDNFPDYVKKAFFPSRTYAGNIGDYVYLRGMLFTLAILMARVSYANNPDIYNNLGGAGGIVIVYDEYNNFQDNFESVFLEVSGEFCNKNRLEFIKLTENIEKLNIEIETISKELEDNDTTTSAQLNTTSTNKSALNTLRKKKQELEILLSGIKAEHLYATTFINKLGETAKYLSTKLRAGFRDSEGNKSDIFVIGQSLEMQGYFGASNPSGTYPQVASGKFNQNDTTKGLSLTRGILDAFPHDYFIGFNHTDTATQKYIGANNKGSITNKWIDEKMYWTYIQNKTTKDITSGETIRGKIFKPYLVLNNHLEDHPSTEESDSDHTFVAQCRFRVNKASKGLWEQVRLKHIAPGSKVYDEGGNTIYGNLNEGIGFAGLAKLTKATVGGEFLPQQDLKKSLDIADYVAGCLGYSSYKEFLFDFTPNGLFSIEDIVNAIGDPASYNSPKNLELRYPLYYKFGMEKYIAGATTSSANTGSGNTANTASGMNNSSADYTYTDDDLYSTYTPDQSQSTNSFTNTSQSTNSYNQGTNQNTNSYNQGINQSTQSAPNNSGLGWTDEERQAAAQMMVNLYLMLVKKNEPNKARMLSEPDVRGQLVYVMKQLLQQEGY